MFFFGGKQELVVTGIVLLVKVAGKYGGIPML